MPRDFFGPKPRRHMPRTKEQYERKYAILTFDTFCRNQELRIKTDLALMERRIHLGGELTPEEKDSDQLVFERRA